MTADFDLTAVPFYFGFPSLLLVMPLQMKGGNSHSAVQPSCIQTPSLTTPPGLCSSISPLGTELNFGNDIYTFEGDVVTIHFLENALVKG
jgi:hypothetical protein